MFPFICIHNINKSITANYDTQTKNIEKEDVSVPIHQVHIPNKNEYQERKRKWYSQWIYIDILFMNEGLYRQISGSNICYTYFMLIKSIP